MTPKHYAYLKIAEGCNRYCSYCAIPLITGKFTSRKIEDIIEEVRWLVEQGVKEFNVIAQDLSSYGLDLYKEHRLAELLDRMAQVPGVEWIRIHYTYPTDFPYDILPVMAKHSNICKYMDIALQHCSDNMLKLMRRHITRKEQDELIARIRREVPGICLRTTLLVGHPGETEEDFAELCEWVKEMKFDRLGAFAYSEEEGTFAARHYKDDIPQAEKDRRVDEIMAIQQQVSAELLSKLVGTEQCVVIDREEADYYVGRTQYDSPEVDCEVLIEKNKPTPLPSLKGREHSTVNQTLKIGEYYNVTIIKSEDFDLYARL
jgi:ribosomal protein S12 methylthiotransferase